jgi:hypothetical protein
MQKQIVEIWRDRVCFFDTTAPISALFEYIKAGKSMKSFLRDHAAVEKEHVVRLLEQSEQLATAYYQTHSNI